MIKFIKSFMKFIWSYGGPFVKRSVSIQAILVEGFKRKKSVFFLNLDQWVSRRCPFKIFLIWSSGSTYFPAERNHLCNFGRGHYDKHFFEFISNLGQWFRGRFLIWSSGGPRVQWNKTIMQL